MAITKINNMERINRKLKRKGLITELTKPEHVAATLEINRQMAEVHQEFLYMSKNNHI